MPFLTCASLRAHRYDSYFQKLDTQGRGHISAEQAWPLFSRAGLPEPTLSEIWALADTDRDALLSPAEFRVAMHLTTIAARGEPLPHALPYALTQSAGLTVSEISAYQRSESSDPSAAEEANIRVMPVASYHVCPEVGLAVT